MKIYTKKGDKGQTGLIGGKQVSKSSIRIRAYGTVDELNSVIGICISISVNEDVKEFLGGIQKELFGIGAYLATVDDRKQKEKAVITEEKITQLEKGIDIFMAEAGEIKTFILPGGSEEASFLHLARCVCRRAETIAVELSEREPVEGLAIKYLNRLSDFLFAAARAVNKRAGAPEIPW